MRAGVHRQLAMPLKRTLLWPGGEGSLRKHWQYVGVHAANIVFGRGLPMHYGYQLRSNSRPPRLRSVRHQ
jgi:hypothetical protein